MTFNHKKDFQDNAARRQWWADVTEQAMFNEAVAAAHLHMQAGLNAPPDLATAASYAYRIEGAKQFAQILANLSENPKPPSQPERKDNLRHS